MGLSAAAAQQRLQQYGPNQLAEKKKEPGWRALRLNAIGYFRKPVDGKALLDAIAWAMQIGSRENNHEKT